MTDAADSTTRPVRIYDTTLRDGMQQEGMSVSVDEKVRIALKLDEMGVHFIEGGFPASNPKETAFFARMEQEQLAHAELVAFGMTRRKGTKAEGDEGLRVLATTFTPTVAVVGKTWGLHLSKVLRVSRDENLRMIDESVRFLVAQGKRVVYDAEHFFDAYRDDAAYALRCVRAAAEAGADVVCLCDTNGASLPTFVHDAVRDVVARVPVTVGVHTHNDSDCAVASSLAAVEAGARHVQGTFNGYGERCGNADLVSIIPALQLKMGLPVVTPEQLARLTETANFVADIVNLSVWPHAPYVGRAAFAHKGGLHVAAVEQAPETFEHIDPALVGNEQRVLVSELSGKGAVLRKARELGVDAAPDDQRVATVLRRLKEREHRGYHYEAADASFELLLRSELAPHEPLFRLESFRVIVEKREDGKAVCEATIKLHVGGERLISTAEGNGPVNALDQALRQAIVSKYPHLADIDLVNYKVRILDEAKGTGAVTRVLLDASDGERTWGSIGVSENIIEASWEALVDSIEYGMLLGEKDD
ncbi:MAG TPA: citramalate synthase [Thermoleophilia bacterium]|nr:citramalate synthase [Thermoleophilia bacterium]HQJ98627.1 citramalate synthase [Thermoleophilia bacterium]